jgi:ketosteroid isomerase-like protein
MVFLCGMVLTTIAVADDADDVRAGVLGLDAAFMAGDVDAVAKYMHPEYTMFLFPGEVRGELLIEGFSKDRLKALFDAGMKVDIETRHLSVKIFGITAVVTSYAAGTVTLPNGTVKQNTRRVTEIWVKEKGQWLRVHIHESPLTAHK